ncbi:hypothetical protein HanXRQr2_Chr09g0389911 [Helianthus annuus]|uniref:Uncharacterized protein n=1 Tax=Helianthus annuus TaxID=4232 RepID=A0A9K3N8E8_HELAN|nr:hypothetical protein HanXRQr2_Chr09g0389911 [Helianthus annuus]KAJ0893274.1 hypothetical protein HanPSC8_Chr09g0375781 [Helianthus annuus]
MSDRGSSGVVHCNIPTERRDLFSLVDRHYFCRSTSCSGGTHVTQLKITPVHFHSIGAGKHKRRPRVKIITRD